MSNNNENNEIDIETLVSSSQETQALCLDVFRANVTEDWKMELNGKELADILDVMLEMPNELVATIRENNFPLAQFMERAIDQAMVFAYDLAVDKYGHQDEEAARLLIARLDEFKKAIDEQDYTDPNRTPIPTPIPVMTHPTMAGVFKGNVVEENNEGSLDVGEVPEDVEFLN